MAIKIFDDLYSRFDSMLKTSPDSSGEASATPALRTDPREGVEDPRVTLEKERKKLLEAEAKKARVKKAESEQGMQDQPFREQMQGQKVALLQQAGQGLEAQKAMQDPNYQLGSGSALQQRRGEIAPDWARMNRASRRLRRQGYTDQAAKMAGMAELERIKTPSLTTQEQRQRMAFMDMERDAKTYEAKRDEDLLNQFLRKRNQRDNASYMSEPV